MWLFQRCEESPTFADASEGSTSTRLLYDVPCFRLVSARLRLVQWKVTKTIWPELKKRCNITSTQQRLTGEEFRTETNLLRIF
mmetsp:Transcript_19081/g.27651  ORF Transcript_19081/g.27651 Transcript_19081/m.27651 type:complete len:83 (-) Transcript_19081:56-304(-)